MAFNKLIFVLAIVSCAFSMPVHDSKQSSDAGSTTNGALKLEDTVLSSEEETSVGSTDDETTIKEEISTTTASTTDQSLDIKVENDRDGLTKRSIEEESNDDDMETAAGTNVLRPLFVYRQQVAYRQRIRNENRRRNGNRRGNRRF